MSQVLIRLKRSVIGQPRKHRAVTDSLGLRKINQKVQIEDSPEIRGMIGKVFHLLAVQDVADVKVEKIAKKIVESETLAAVKEKETVAGEKTAAKTAKQEIVPKKEVTDKIKAADKKKVTPPEEAAAGKKEVAEKKVTADKKAAPEKKLTPEKDVATEEKASAEKKVTPPKEIATEEESN